MSEIYLHESCNLITHIEVLGIGLQPIEGVLHKKVSLCNRTLLISPYPSPNAKGWGPWNCDLIQLNTGVNVMSGLDLSSVIYLLWFDQEYPLKCLVILNVIYIL